VPVAPSSFHVTAYKAVCLPVFRMNISELETRKADWLDQRVIINFASDNSLPASITPRLCACRILASDGAGDTS
jgi:hypothetical protein